MTPERTRCIMINAFNRIPKAAPIVIIGISTLSVCQNAAAQAKLKDGVTDRNAQIEVILGDTHLKLPLRDIRPTTLSRKSLNDPIYSINLIGTTPNLWGVIPPGPFDPGSKDSSNSMQASINFIPGISHSNTSLLPAGVSGREAQFGLKSYQETEIQDTTYTPSKPFPRKLQIVCVPPVGILEYCRLYTTYSDNIAINITFDRKDLSKWREIDQSVQKILIDGLD